MDKKQASDKARLVRSTRTKNKVVGAVNILRLYSAKINPNTVHKECGVSRATAKKYLVEMGLYEG